MTGLWLRLSHAGCAETCWLLIDTCGCFRLRLNCSGRDESWPFIDICSCWQVCTSAEGVTARANLVDTWQEDGWAADKIEKALEVQHTCLIIHQYNDLHLSHAVNS